MSGRAVPFHCPYCGDVDLRPHEVEDGPSHGAWECRSCLRAFKLTMIGRLRHPSTTPTEIPSGSEAPR
jgi:transcription elongation factor Elf1